MQWLAALRRAFRPRPLDWTRGVGRPAAERPRAVDVIVPVYGAADDLARCLDSVAAHASPLQRVLLVIDGPQDAAVEAVLARHAATMRVVRNEQRLGFVGTANRGMRETTNDVVLLNSDTIVTARWLEKLIDAAYSHGDVGTVTPLSNHATLCSVPRAFEENLLPSGFDVDSFAKLVEEASGVGRSGQRPAASGQGRSGQRPAASGQERAEIEREERAACDNGDSRQLTTDHWPLTTASPATRGLAADRWPLAAPEPPRYPRLPTAVGFCMYIRRALLDDIGPFDAEHFGLGYGEENDFSLRALKRGWLHIADDATFIYHAGHRSFGAVRERQQRRAYALLAKTHPRYMPTIAAFMRADPLAPMRARIVSALAPRAATPQLRIAHLVHGWPPWQFAGTELYAYWLAMRQRERHEVSVYARSADRSRAEGEAVELCDRGVRVRLVTNSFTRRDPRRRNALRDPLFERDFARFLRETKPDVLHVHHLAGHAFSLNAVARRMGIPIVMQLQDWWQLCARVNYQHRDGTRCTGPAPAKCAACVTLTHLPLMNAPLHAMRRRAARKALAVCDAFIAGSNAIRDAYAPIVPRATPFHVLPYGIAIDAPREPRGGAQRPVRFGYVGSITPHKGVQTAVEAMHGVDATLHLWGDASAQPQFVATLRAMTNVVFEGRFAEEEKARVFASMDVLIVPSIGLESFGLAAREAMASGVPVIATSGGALDEMFAPDLCGAFFPPGDATALHSILQRVANDPAIIDAWASRLPVPKRDDVHADEIEAVYRSVLQR